MLLHEYLIACLCVASCLFVSIPLCNVLPVRVWWRVRVYSCLIQIRVYSCFVFIVSKYLIAFRVYSCVFVSIFCISIRVYSCLFLSALFCRFVASLTTKCAALQAHTLKFCMFVVWRVQTLTYVCVSIRVYSCLFFSYLFLSRVYSCLFVSIRV